MSRIGQNVAFLRSSFLSAAYAPYIEDMQAEYERNPGAVSDEWRRFFESIKEPTAEPAFTGGPAWAPPLSALLNDKDTDRDLVSALTGDYGETERTIRDKIERHAQLSGFELSPAASIRATQDSIRALMLIRAYRVIGHLAADLDPLGLADRRVHRELLPETYGFTEADLDRPIFIDRVMGLGTATMREILTILRRTYCRQIGFQFVHITDPAQKGWIQERIEGPEKDISFTPEGRKAILRKLIEAETFEKFCDLKYTGTKRFGLEGAESMIPALEQIIKRGGHLGVREITLGMAHRGRLNVLANVLTKPLRAIFKEFKGG
jgi:2-oxoglutarate dehydrogenase E1 component